MPEAELLGMMEEVNTHLAKLHDYWLCAMETKADIFRLEFENRGVPGSKNVEITLQRCGTISMGAGVFPSLVSTCQWSSADDVPTYLYEELIGRNVLTKKLDTGTVLYIASSYGFTLLVELGLDGRVHHREGA